MEIIYRKEKTGVVIERCLGVEERIELPEFLDGLPVTAVESYAFSDANPRVSDEKIAVCGQKLLEISLPRNLRRIGNYAFYGCRKLEKITMFHRTEDIAGGAFTGCARLRELCIFMEDADGYCLKDIVSEIHHELYVDLIYPENSISVADQKLVHPRAKTAKLLFPEYFEEAVENTPARILETHVHGSGCHYRQCFHDGELNYPEYDRMFAGAVAWESVDFCTDLALRRLLYPYCLSKDAKGVYISFLIEHRMDAAKWCIVFEQNEALEYISSFVDWQEEELQELIQDANRQGRVEIQSFLLDYKHTHFGKKKKLFAL